MGREQRVQQVLVPQQAIRTFRYAGLDLASGLEQLPEARDFLDPHPQVDDDQIRKLREIDGLAVDS
jgi:hypothetical protein